MVKVCNLLKHCAVFFTLTWCKKRSSSSCFQTIKKLWSEVMDNLFPCCRVVLAMTPYSPDSPDVSEVSDTEALLRWKQPKNDGNSPIICYNVQYKETCKFFSIVVPLGLKQSQLLMYQKEQRQLLLPSISQNQLKNLKVDAQKYSRTPHGMGRHLTG